MSNSSGWLAFLRSRTFVIQVILGLVLIFGLLFGVLEYLSSVTHHNEEISVPDLSGMNKADLDAVMEERRLRYVILDSVFSDESEKGIVLGQNPPALSKVKVNRTIYLTISAKQPPSVKLPLLVDKSLRQAKSIIENVGLHLGELQYRPDQCVNCVLSQSVRGRDILRDTVLPKGTKIDLVLGGGLSNEKILVPFILNLTRKQAIEKLKASYLNLGAEQYDESVFDLQDSLEARVFHQSPGYSADSWVPMGSSVDVEFTLLHTKIDSVPVLDSAKYKQYVPDTTLR